MVLVLYVADKTNFTRDMNIKIHIENQRETIFVELTDSQYRFCFECSSMREPSDCRVTRYLIARIAPRILTVN